MYKINKYHSEYMYRPYAIRIFLGYPLKNSCIDNFKSGNPPLREEIPTFIKRGSGGNRVFPIKLAKCIRPKQ